MEIFSTFSRKWICPARAEEESLRAFLQKVINKERSKERTIFGGTAEYGGDGNNIRTARIGDLDLRITKNSGNPSFITVNDKHYKSIIEARIYRHDLGITQLIDQIFRFGDTEEEALDKERESQKNFDEYCEKQNQEMRDLTNEEREERIRRLNEA